MEVDTAQRNCTMFATSLDTNDLTVKGQKFIEHLTFETETIIMFRNVGTGRPVRRCSTPKEREIPKKSFVVLFDLCAFIYIIKCLCSSG